MKKVNNKIGKENKNGSTVVTSEDLEKAAKVLEDAAQKKRNECWEEILAVADKHNFVLGINYTFILAPKQ